MLAERSEGMGHCGKTYQLSKKSRRGVKGWGNPKEPLFKFRGPQGNVGILRRGKREHSK